MDERSSGAIHELTTHTEGDLLSLAKYTAPCAISIQQSAAKLIADG